MVGQILGHYEIIEPLGKGGMGEVYRARDTKLERDVAIKVLPEDFSADADRLARFEREAKLLAALNHANIAAIYGLEDEGDQRFIAMELVDGDTLAERIAGAGRLETEEALEIARQITEALEAAHESGVIHRDLKPANIIVTAAGKAKVLDYGLAKAVLPEGTDSSESLTHSPTATVGATEAGVLLGTAPYMSPEQAKGRVVDKRTDIWAFGCLLFEMLTGKRPFQGENVTETLAAVLKEEPDWGLLPEETPPFVALLVRRCLRKDPNNRLRDIGDARIEIVDAQRRGVGEGSRIGAANGATPSSGGPRGLPWAAGIVIGLAIGVAASSLWAGARLADGPGSTGAITRFSIRLPSGQRFTNTGGRVLDISPDGRRIAYVADRQLWVRDMQADQPRLIAGTQVGGTRAIRDIFFSHDGEWVGFTEGPAVRRASATAGGATTTLWPLEATPWRPWRPHWTASDVIYVGAGDQGIWRGPGAGGNPEPVIRLQEGERAHAPQLLPGDEWMLYSLLPAGSLSMANARVVVESLRTGERDVLVEGRDARYVPTGHLLYAVGEVVLAAPFDTATRTVTGAARPAIASVYSLQGASRAQYSVADNGTLVYLAADAPTTRSLVWVERSGSEHDLGAPPSVYSSPRVSPDGSKVLVGVADVDGSNPGRAYWDVGGRVLTPLPFEGPSSSAWTADSSQIFVATDRLGGGRELYSMPIDGRTGVDNLLTTPEHSRPMAATDDGGVIYVQRGRGSEDMDILWFRPGDTAPRPLLASEAHEGRPVLSPDERWLAYESDESVLTEVWMASFPDAGEYRVRISNGGGTEPKWSPHGDELYYVDPDESVLMAVPFDSSDGSFGAATALFSVDEYELPLSNGSNFDVAPDGRFVFMRAVAAPGDVVGGAYVNVVLNWFEELKEMFPPEASR